MSGAQTLVVKSDQEASIIDVKESLMRELRGVEGLKVKPEESPVGASAANAVIERSVWEMQSTTRAIVAYTEWVHETTFEFGSAIVAWGWWSSRDRWLLSWLRCCQCLPVGDCPVFVVGWYVLGAEGGGKKAKHSKTCDTSPVCCLESSLLELGQTMLEQLCLDVARWEGPSQCADAGRCTTRGDLDL